MAHGHRWLIGVASVVVLSTALVLIVVGQPSVAEDGVIYVDAEAPGPTHDGNTWDTAYTDLQAALDAATDGDEIWVATGVYTPTSRLDAGDARSATFQLSNEVAIYGGFAGNETELGQRDWQTNLTILSGDIGIEGDPADNSYHVLYNTGGLDGTAVLDGFTVAGANADGDELLAQDSGGGMYNDASSPTLANLTFEGNTALGSGAGMHNTSGSSPTLTNCSFRGNSADTEGGGIHNDGSAPSLTGCTFSANTADAGGGIYNGDSSPALTNVTFAGNSANSGGGMHNDGSSPVLVNCVFKGNSAGGNGGGLRNTRSSTPTLTNCTFQGNRATNGGAMHNYDNSPPTITNCILWGDSQPEIVNKDSAPATITYSDIQGGLYTGTGNLNDDPLFVDAAAGDLRLQPTSPAIDAGNNEAPALAGITTDLGGRPRFFDVVPVPDTGNGTPPIVDMGAHEALWHPVYLPLVLRAY